MIGFGRPHHSTTGFSRWLFSPSLAFMVVLDCCLFVVVCDGFQRGFVVVVLLVFCGGSRRSSWWFCGRFLSGRMVCGSRSRYEFGSRSGNLLVGKFLAVGILCFVRSWLKDYGRVLLLGGSCLSCKCLYQFYHEPLLLL